MTGDRFAEIRDAAGTVSRETFEQLGAFESEFRRWARRINLAAPSTIDSLWQRHILDSAQLAKLKPDALKWLDLGSGGGFPGAVLAILLRERPGAWIDLVESNNKKAAFLKTVLASVGAPARVHIGRIEDSFRLLPKPEIVTARALAPFNKLLALASPWLMTGSTGLFHKGRDYRNEIAESRDAWQFDLVEHRSRVDPEGRILEITGLRPSGATPDRVNATFR